MVSHVDRFVINAALSPVAACVALRLSLGEVLVVNLTNGGELWRAQRSTFRGRPITYSPDGRLLVTTGSHGDGAGTIILWNAMCGSMLRELRGHDAPVTELVFSKDGLLYSTDMHGVVRSWNLQRQCESWSVPRHLINRSHGVRCARREK